MRNADGILSEPATSKSIFELASIDLHRLAQLGEGLALDLPNSLPRQAEAITDLLERLGVFATQAETEAKHGGLPLGHLLQRRWARGQDRVLARHSFSTI